MGLVGKEIEAFEEMIVILVLWNMVYAEQKVKVPSLHCDARVKTVCADVMNLPKHQVRALSPQVLFYGHL